MAARPLAPSHRHSLPWGWHAGRPRTLKRRVGRGSRPEKRSRLVTAAAGPTAGQGPPGLSDLQGTTVLPLTTCTQPWPFGMSYPSSTTHKPVFTRQTLPPPPTHPPTQNRFQESLPIRAILNIL